MEENIKVISDKNNSATQLYVALCLKKIQVNFGRKISPETFTTKVFSVWFGGGVGTRRAPRPGVGLEGTDRLGHVLAAPVRQVVGMGPWCTMGQSYAPLKSSVLAILLYLICPSKMLSRRGHQTSTVGF